jgi:hypothetical protein
VKGYPVGTFILWKTKEALRSIRDLGGHKLPEPPAGDFIEYVLDGQQRITSIYATIRGLAIERDGVTDSFAEFTLTLKRRTRKPSSRATSPTRTPTPTSASAIC